MTIPVLIVPGLGGSGEQHWQTHLERSLPHAARVHQSDWDRPDLTQWLERLAQAVKARPGVLLVAHSLACPLVAHFAARRPDLPVSGALLVAPADVDSARHTPSHTRGFAPIPRLRLPFQSVIVGSANDPFIEIDRCRDLADAWGAEFVNVGSCGHINVASGFGPWPAGESVVATMLAWAGTPRRLTGGRLRAAANSQQLLV